MPKAQIYEAVNKTLSEMQVRAPYRSALFWSTWAGFAFQERPTYDKLE
jgi:hypothetical protein